MTKYVITDPETGRKLDISADIMSIALDLASETLGYLDYPDLMQERCWNSEAGEGLHIVEIKH